MKLFLPILFWLWPLTAMTQAKDTLRKSNTVLQPTAPSSKTIPSKDHKPEIFTSGFIDIINNGQVNASARFVRLNVGEPGKFSVPLSFYSGVSTNNFQNTQGFGNQRSNE